MTSKEALEKLSYIPIYEEDKHNVITDIDSCCVYKGDLCEVYGSEVDTIEKDLEVLQIIKDVFNYKTTQKFVDHMSKEDLKKLKEWLGND